MGEKIKKCRHLWKEEKNKKTCEICGKTEFIYYKTSIDGIKHIIRSNGRKYSIRDSQKRYFFPDEWISFLKALKKDKRFLFYTLMMTGGRISEVLNLRKSHINIKRKYLIFCITKRKISDKENNPEHRYISLSTSYLKELKKYIKKRKLKLNEYIFLNNNKINTEKGLKKEINSKKVSAERMLKRTLKKIGLDWYNFSLHNIRKTHGMYLKALGVGAEEICLRMGHGLRTYLRHYGSADIFMVKDRKKIKNILGDIYNLQKNIKSILL